MASTELEKRFWARVNKPADSNACWVWQGSDNGNGYGQISKNYKKIYVHRFSYQIHVGDIPNDMTVHHSCMNTRCVNPSHLRLATRGENTLMGYAINVAASKRRAITHCRHGHEYNEKNTYVSSSGSRHCRSCRLRRVKESKWRAQN